MTAANVKQLLANTKNEKIPMALSGAAEVAMISSVMTAWFPGEAGMIEGAAVGSILPYRWKSFKDQQAFVPAGASKPIIGYDSALKKSYFQFGYGGSLARRTNTLKALKPVSNGTGYVTGEVVTLSNGVVVTYTGTTGLFSATGFSITNFGTFSTLPTALLTQVSTTGSGAGVTMIPEFVTDCGSLALTPSPALIPTTLFSLFVVFRCPVVGGAAGADPGGFIVGGQLNESEQYNVTGNSRYWGLKIGNPNLGAGRLSMHLTGDAVRVDAPLATDFRDGNWHVAMISVLPGGVSTMWIDGANVGTRVGTFSALNPTAGFQSMRVGAAGLPADGPTGGAALDVGSVMIVPLDLNDSANITLRQLIGNYLLSKWKGGGSHG